jgi:hypothetical protein
MVNYLIAWKSLPKIIWEISVAFMSFRWVMRLNLIYVEYVFPDQRIEHSCHLEDILDGQSMCML